MELTVGIEFRDQTGFSMSNTGSILLIPTNKVRHRPLTSSLKYDLNKDGLGMLIDLAPSLGRTIDDWDDSVWSKGILENDSDDGQYSEGLRPRSEIDKSVGLSDVRTIQSIQRTGISGSGPD